MHPYPCPPRGQMQAPGKEDPVFLAIRYAECDARPVRRLTHGCGCGCDETDCDWSRIQDSWELALLWQLPDVYAAAAAADQAWRDAAQAAAAAGEPLRAPACPPAADEPWVVLARIVLPADRADPIATISPPPRLLLTAGALDVLALRLTATVCVPRIPSTALTSRVADPVFPRCESLYRAYRAASSQVTGACLA